MKCKVCETETDVIFNIDFKATPICEPCAEAIFLQQAHWYTKEFREARKFDPRLNCPQQTINNKKAK